MIDDSVVPEWMKRKRDRDEAGRAYHDAQAAKDRVAQLLVESRAPKFWELFKQKLFISVQALPTLKLSGSFDSPPNDPNRVHLEVARHGHFPRISSADIYFDGAGFRATGLIGVLNFQMVAKDENEVAAQDVGSVCLDPDGAVEVIMRQMVGQVERQ